MRLCCGVCGWSPGPLAPDQVILEPHEQEEGRRARDVALAAAREASRRARVITPRTRFTHEGRTYYVTGRHAHEAGQWYVSDTDGGGVTGSYSEELIRAGLLD